MELIKQLLRRVDDLERRIDKLEIHTQLTGKKLTQGQSEKQSSGDLILSIVNKIGECDESDEIQNNILDQSGMEGKILLCFFISYKYFKNAWITTGDIEKITSALGTKIAVGNVSNKIKGELRQYLESGSVQKKGNRLLIDSIVKA